MKILIGKVVKPQGVKGELKVYPADSNLDIYKNIKEIYIDNSSEPTKIKHMSLRQGFIYLTLQGLSDRTKAELYRNKSLYVNEEDIILNENTYYTENLIGIEVVDKSNNYIGTVVDIESYGAADVITILEEDKREYKIPFLTSVVVSVKNDYLIVDKQRYNEVKICE